MASIIDYDFRSEHVLSHHHTHINSAPVIMYTGEKKPFFRYTVTFVLIIFCLGMGEGMIIHERTKKNLLIINL